MNIANNMEAIFCIAVALVSVTAPTATAGKMQVVVISARRLNAFDTAGTVK